MEITAQAKYVRVSPRKAGLVVALVRGSKVNEALNQLKFVNKKAGRFVSKLLESAVANAQHNYDIAADNLLIKQIWVGKGSTFHRWMPRAHGRATPLSKTTSHITIVLSEIKDSGVRQARRIEATAPLKLSDLAQGGQNKPADKVATVKSKDVIDEIEAKSDNFEQEAKREGSSKSGFVKKMFQRKAG